MSMRNNLCLLVIGLAFVDAPPESSSTTILARSKILASRLLALASVMAGLAAPWSILGANLAASPSAMDWPIYLGDKGRSLYSPLQQINRSNVAQLKVAWTY